MVHKDKTIDLKNCTYDVFACHEVNHNQSTLCLYTHIINGKTYCNHSCFMGSFVQDPCPPIGAKCDLSKYHPGENCILFWLEDIYPTLRIVFGILMAIFGLSFICYGSYLIVINFFSNRSSYVKI